ncbi:MAG: hypothetical protein ACP5IG_01755 [Candidatus Micrarchaeia archaeon]|jgi:hypothetical protein
MTKKLVLWALFFLVLAIVVPPFLSLVDYSLNAKNSQQIDAALAAKLIKDDARAAFGESAAVTLKSLNQKNGKWEAEVEIEQEPHSACPKLYRRYYSLMPIYSVTENVLTSCQALPPVSNRVEAIIFSSKLASIAQHANANAYACAFKAGEEIDSSYCPKASPAEIKAFADSTPRARWITAWFYGDGSTALIALDEKGSVVAQR